MLTVFRRDDTKSFRSYIIQSTICQNAILFFHTEEEGTNHNVIRLTYDYVDNQQELAVGVILIDDPAFVDVNSFELCSKLF